VIAAKPGEFTAARRRQPQLRQAEAQHDIGIPQQIEVLALNPGKGQAIGRIDDERHPAGRAMRSANRVPNFVM